MQFLAFFRWWYGAGWLDQFELSRLRLRKIGDYFSIGLLFRTLFQPFRQISAGSVRGGLDVQVRAWLDRLISRAIGGMVRLVMIIIGSVWWCFSMMIAIVWLFVWIFVPVLPFVAFALTQGGLI